MNAGLLTLVLMCLCASISSVPVEIKKTTSYACASQEEDSGYVCVCNSTYCDTIEAPTKLKTSKYYHYYTSETTPGFNVEKGSFGTKKTSSGNTMTVTVDSSTTYQTFMGVGGGFSDSAAYVYYELPTAARKNLLESYFGTSGVEFTFARVPIGMTDFSTTTYSYDDTTDDVNMTNFALTDFEINYKMPFLLAALDATNRSVKLLATPWTSPDWMKDNNSTDPGFLIPEYHEALANYIIKFLEAYKTYDFDFWGLSPINEPVFGIDVDFSMPNVMMLPPQYRELIRDYVGPLMEEAGFSDVKILALDDERPFLDWYSKALLGDEDTAAYIDGFAVHWYSDDTTNTQAMDDFNANYPDKFLLYTEASGGDTNSDGDVVLGDWANAEEYIADIIESYQHYATGYMIWNLCLNLQGGPYTQMSQTSPIIVDTSSGKFYKQPLYYSMGHFSKFIYPDSVRIGLTITNSSSVELDTFGKKKTTTTTTEANPTGGFPTGGPNPTGGSHTGGPTGGGPTGGSNTGGPNPTGGSHTGGPTGGGPTGGSHTGGPTGGGPTGGGNPTQSPDDTTYTFDGVATTNPDGSKTVILFNPTTDSVTVKIVDSDVGTLTTTVEANSLNSFVYW